MHRLARFGESLGPSPPARHAAALHRAGAHALLLADRDGGESGGGGVVWSWGYNESYQLGWPAAAGSERAAAALRSGFQKPCQPLELGGDVVAVACGAAHSAAVLAEGVLLLWGDNSRGQCSGGGAAGAAALGRLVAMPEACGVFETEPVRSVLCCGNNTLALLCSGRAYLLGGGRTQQDPCAVPNDSGDGDGDGDGDSDGEEARRRGGSDTGSLVDAGGGGSAWGLRLGGLAEGLRLFAEGVRCGALCDDHVLLLGDDAGAATVRGFGYNRYGQAAPGDERLRVPQPTPLSLGLFGAQVPVAVAVGGGASAALTVAPETLAARCRAALRTELRAGNATCCAELLVLLTRCEAPWLAPLAACVSECAAAQQPDVERACAAAGIRLDEALEALAKLP